MGDLQSLQHTLHSTISSVQDELRLSSQSSITDLLEEMKESVCDQISRSVTSIKEAVKNDASIKKLVESIAYRSARKDKTPEVRRLPEEEINFFKASHA
jgi:hypothetical protein